MCFILGNNDHVRCFYCGIGLQNWDSEDNPFVEHARWSSECQYLKDKKENMLYGFLSPNIIYNFINAKKLEHFVIGRGDIQDTYLI
jgi:hypothetical protein